MTDVIGHPLSSRSHPSGPGSRGGHWDDPMYRAGYAAGWRKGNPAYRAKERLRKAELRRARALVRDRARVDKLIRMALPKPQDPRRDFARWLGARMTEYGMSQRELGDYAAIDHVTIKRLLDGDREPLFSTVVDLAAALGYAVTFVAPEETP